MRAALLLRPGEIVVGDVAEPEPGPDDVRIAVGGVGLCGSDQSVYSGKWTAPEYPWIQGHEAFGTVDAVGERVPPRRIGQVVVVEPNIACLRCAQCAVGRTSACTQRQSIGMNRTGALAEKLVVPADRAWPVGGLGPTDLVCAEPLTVVETALRRLSSPVPGSALVVGVGSQGLLMCLALIRRGIQVHAYDVNADRLAFASELGAASTTVDGDAAMDLVVDTVGSPASTELALRRVAIGGTVLFLGLDASPFEISAQMLVRRQLVLRGSLTYDHPADFGATVALLEAGEVSPGRVITDEYPLEDAGRAFESSGTARGKTWIRVSASA